MGRISVSSRASETSDGQSSGRSSVTGGRSSVTGGRSSIKGRPSISGRRISEARHGKLSPIGSEKNSSTNLTAGKLPSLPEKIGEERTRRKTKKRLVVKENPAASLGEEIDPNAHLVDSTVSGIFSDAIASLSTSQFGEDASFTRELIQNQMLSMESLGTSFSNLTKLIVNKKIQEEQSERSSRPNSGSKKEKVREELPVPPLITNESDAVREEILKIVSTAAETKSLMNFRTPLPPLQTKTVEELMQKNNLAYLTVKQVEFKVDDPFGVIMQNLPNYDFPKVQTGLKKLQFGGKEPHYFNKSKIFEVDAYDPDFAQKINNEVIAPLTREEKKRMEIENAPLEFLKNPRFISPDQINELIAEPSSILFEDYIPYKVYTAKLIIRNASKVSHRYRLEYFNGKTISQFFKFKLISSPIKDDSLVARGLCCVYEVSFCPISFANYEETLIVKSEAGCSFTIPIMAHRQAPKIQLPKELDCGQCTPGYTSKRVFNIKNSGGFARFLVKPATDKRSAFEVFDQIGTADIDLPNVTIGPFTISPGYFSIDAGKTQRVIIKYSPKVDDLMNSGDHSGDIDIYGVDIACDNCQTFQHKLLGQHQQPNLVITEAVFLDKGQDCIIEKKDIFDAQIDFQEGHLHAPDMCLLSVKNTTGMVLPYRWIHCDYRHGMTQLDELKDNLDIFKFVPSSGAIEPYKTQKFRVIFCPSIQSSFESLAEIVLTGEIGANDPLPMKLSMFKNEMHACLSRVRLLGSCVPYKVSLNTEYISIPPDIKIGEVFSTTVQIFNQCQAPIEYSWTLEGINDQLVQISLLDSDGTVDQDDSVELKVIIKAFTPIKILGKLVCITANGFGPTLNVIISGQISRKHQTIIFDRPCIDFGLIALGNEQVATIDLINITNFPTGWKISQPDSVKNAEYLIKYHPSKGNLEPLGRQTLEFTLIPTSSQLIYGSVKLLLTSIVVKDDANDEKQISLHNPITVAGVDFIGEVETPRISLLNSKNNFSCFIGVPVAWGITLQNDRKLGTYFKFPDNQYENFTVSFSPPSGYIAGGESQDIKVRICFFKIGSMTNIELVGFVMDMVENGGQIVLNLNVDVMQYDFSFRVLDNEKAWETKAIMKPAHRLPETLANLRLDFGMVCPVTAVRTRTVKIRNRTALESNFSIKFKKYNSASDHRYAELGSLKNRYESRASLSSESMKTMKSEKNQLLKTTENPRFGFSSKSGQKYVDTMNKFRLVIEHMKTILSDGRGAAFHAEPNQGYIQPWGEVEISVSSYNNLVGEYYDEMVFKMGNFEKAIPVRLGVIGCPLKISGASLISREKEVQRGRIDVEKINFGTRVIYTTDMLSRISSANKSSVAAARQKALPSEFQGAFYKTVTVENNCPQDVLLKWKIFEKHFSVNNEGDSKDSTVDYSDNLKTEMIVLPENQTSETFFVYPAVMNIPSFKSQQLRIYFRAHQIGFNEALAISDVSYLQPDGSYSLGPKRIIKPMAELQDGGNISKPITIKDLESCIALGIRSKVIEPKLSLEGPYIRIKAPFQTDAKVITTAYLYNRSDAICEFEFTASPSDNFKVKGSKKHEKKPGLYELKQTEQLIFTIEYVPTPPILIPAESNHNITISQSRRSSTLAKSAYHHEPQSRRGSNKMLQRNSSGLSTIGSDHEGRLDNQSRRGSNDHSKNSLNVSRRGSDKEITRRGSDKEVKTEQPAISRRSSFAQNKTRSRVETPVNVVLSTIPDMARDEDSDYAGSKEENELADVVKPLVDTLSPLHEAEIRLSQTFGRNFDQSKPKSPPRPNAIATGELVINYTNGMVQTFEIVVEYDNN